MHLSHDPSIYTQAIGSEVAQARRDHTELAECMSWRYRFTFLILVAAFSIIVVRLFYWQIIKRDELSALALSQYSGVIKLLPQRGQIKTSDNFPIASNRVSYLIFANPKNIKDKKKIANTLSLHLKSHISSISSLLSLDRFWVLIKSGVDTKTKDTISKLGLQGIGFEQQFNRFYPEASVSAQLLGFVGKDESGVDKGYFGLEGYYDRLLRGKEEYIVEIQDALGRPILSKMTKRSKRVDGSSLKLSVERSIQFLVEQKLKKGIEKYGASSGMVGVMNPRTGHVIAMAAFPSFSPDSYQDYNEDVYKNPFISNTFEPGSSLKPLVMSGALDASVVTPKTKCNICGGPITIGGYELHTWNDKYFKDTNMIDVIRRSDNTGMVFVAQKLGVDRMISYLTKFGIGQLTDIDLQGEVAPSLKPKKEWYSVDLATAGFGQGISLTPIELLDAFAAIANKGKRMQLLVVASVERSDGKIIKITPKVLSQPISEKTAKLMTEILVNAVNKGEAQWTKLKGYRIAGKTGTASIPVAGHYDPEKTIASFIGFVPADDPKFVMLVILDKPTTSIYASETSAPLFFDIAKDLLSYYGIPPSE